MTSLRNVQLLLCLGFLMIATGCAKKSMKTSIVEKSAKEEYIKKIDLDTMVVDGNDPDMIEVEEEEATILSPYNPAAERIWDLLHTKLNLSFNWENQTVNGIAELTLKPYFYKQNAVSLDAKNFVVSSIKDEKGVSLEFDNTGKQLIINLLKTYTRTEELKLTIQYVANPESTGDASGNAITSDKGLFFINPKGEEGDKPKQIWSQGETENNSRWFPTIDKPNERCTQEITLTVEDKYVTLSNGLMISSKKNNDGTRTDTWKQDKPHAPYLFMIAVGEFAVVKDQWKDIPLNYLVEQKYAPYAKQIFNHTPEMLEFFSDKLNYKYPWDKYSQIITRDYVSGAMENTSAVIFGEFIQKTDRELIDDDNDAIVAHELFHHWFGDLVTCESWANLTLNEGFANYSEYLWLEHKYGIDRADDHRNNEKGGYLASAADGVHPLIHYRYGDKEQMFDAHSYNKGGLVLHMLRTYLGDDAFFAGLNYYLNANKYTSVEVDELRIAFEEVTGKDLNWFFDQWFLREGHPSIIHSYTYDPSKKQLTNIVTQNQNQPFKLLFDLATYDDKGQVTYHNVTIENATDTVVIELASPPLAVMLDGKDDVLAEISDTSMTEDNMYAVLQYALHLNQRTLAAEMLIGQAGDLEKFVKIAYNDKAYKIKAQAIEVMSPEQGEAYEKQIMRDAEMGIHSSLRATAINKLVELNLIDSTDLLRIIGKEKAYPVLNTALAALSSIAPFSALKAADQLSDSDDNLAEGLGMIYTLSSDPAKLDWYLKTIDKTNVYKSYPLYGAVIEYLNNMGEIVLFEKAVNSFAERAMDTKVEVFKRFLSTAVLKGMSDMSNGPDAIITSELSTTIKALIDKIKSKETNQMLIDRYSQF